MLIIYYNSITNHIISFNYFQGHLWKNLQNSFIFFSHFPIIMKENGQRKRKRLPTIQLTSLPFFPIINTEIPFIFILYPLGHSIIMKGQVYETFF